MAYTLVDGTALNPIADLFDIEDFPLSDFLPSDEIESVFDGLFYVEADSHVEGDNLVLSARLAISADLALGIPGSDAFAIVLASAGVGWTTFVAEIVLGPDLSFRFVDVAIGLRVSEKILRDVASGLGTELTISGNLVFDAEGISLETTEGITLQPAYLADTEIIVEADDVRPVFGYNAPGWLEELSEFRGLTIEELRVTIPDDYISVDSGTLEITLSEAAIGSTGFSGEVALTSADLADPVSGTFLGFPFEFREFRLDIEQNALIELSLGLDIRFEALEDGATQKWVGIDFNFQQGGALSGAVSATQPASASSSAHYLVDAEFADVLHLGVNSLRISKEASNLWAVHFSGAMELLIDGASWPELEFDEIGIDSNGKFLLSDGAGITFAAPLVVDWHFVGLTVTKFRFGYAENSDTKLEIGLSAEVALIEGLPMGASVEGLVVQWEPGSGAAPEVRLDGIGVEFGVPGSFYAGIKLAYTNDGGAVEFRGSGSLELSALDMYIDVGVVIGNDGFNYLYLFADAKLLPTGIPIGATGLSIYGFQGLLAYNMALDIQTSLPQDERYYEIFTRSPIGVTDTSKWVKQQGQNALGIGVVLGTIDKGFLLNTKGLSVIAFPDLTLLLQTRVDFLKIKPDLDSTSEGSLDALLVYASGQSTLSLDISASWEVPVLYSVSGQARAFFDFDDPGAWYLQLGEDAEGKRITAQVLFWGNGWLFSAGYWFRLDADKMITGIKIEVGLRAEAGGFWAEASGWAYGEMSLFFEPFQWEGLLGLGGRVGAGYRGVSISVEFEGNARTRVFKPFDVYVEVSACIHALLWDICKSFDFEWETDVAPELESPIRGWSAKPRHWTPRDISSGDTAELETGVVTLSTSGTAKTIPPHSIISLDFAKPMVDETSNFNEAVSLNNDGYLTVGEKSGYSARYAVSGLKVIRDPDGHAETITIWGTWAQEALEPNTTLRLLSSERFDHDGSSSFGWATRLSLDYCDDATDTVACVPLDDITPGYGWLEDGSIYHWDIGDDEGPRDDGTLGPDDTLEVDPAGPDEDITVTTGDEGYDETPVQPGEPQGDSPGPAKDAPAWCSALWCLCRIPVCKFLTPALALLGLAVLLLFVALLFDNVPRALVLLSFLAAALAFALLGVRWLCDCGWEDERVGAWLRKHCGGTTTGRPPDVQQQPVDPVLDDGPQVGESGDQDDDDGGQNSGQDSEDTPVAGAVTGEAVTTSPSERSGNWVVSGQDTNGERLDGLYYLLGHGPREWGEYSVRGGSKTTNESWTVPADMQIFEPNETYEIELKYVARLKDKKGNVSYPLGSEVAVSSRFNTDGPPDYDLALQAYIADVYPSDGHRPVYLGYDFLVRFVEAYVPYLYTGVQETLVIRLRDGQGDLVTDSDGNTLLIPATTDGAVERTVTEEAWAEIYAYNITEGCIEGPPDYTDTGPTVQTLSADIDFELTPNSQYVAELVSDSDTGTVLFTWSFATSRFKFFEDLVTDGREVLPSRVAAAELRASDFDELCREADVDTVSYAEYFRVTPILSVDGTVCDALLLEAPEPMEFGTRLAATLDGVAALATANVDGTRAFVMPDGMDWSLGTRTLKLRWQRDAGDAVPVLSVAGDSADETVEFTLELTG